MALRGKPWNRHLSFAEFCEYVLPYRVESEEAQPWREVYAARFAPLVADTATALEAATAINDSLKNFKMRIARMCCAVSITPLDIVEPGNLGCVENMWL